MSSTLNSNIKATKVNQNAVVLRIETATLTEPDATAYIEIEKNGKRVEFFQQPLDNNNNQTDYIDLIPQNTFESNKKSLNTLIWATKFNGDYSNGDIWVPLYQNDMLLKVRVKSGKFDGSCELNLEIKNPKHQYDLFNTEGKKITNSNIRITYEFGTQYEIDFRTGDPQFAVGTGTEVSDNKCEEEGEPKKESEPKEDQNKVTTDKKAPKKALDTKIDKDCNISFKINGLSSMTRFYQCIKDKQIELKCPKTNRISYSSKHKFFVRESIGAPISVSVRLISSAGVFHTWFFEKLILKTVGNNKEEIIMPCYQWITDGKIKTISLPFGILPEHKPQYEKLYLERLNEIDAAKSKYQWDIEKVIPSFIRGTKYGAYDLLPLNERFDKSKNQDFNNLKLQGAINAIQNENALKDITITLDIYDKLYNSKDITKPEITANNWTDDVFFGWTCLAGTNPIHLKLCKTVPPQFIQNKDLLKDSTGNPINVDEECKNGKLFHLDYTDLIKYNLHNKGVPSDPDIQVGRKYSAPCNCLLYVGNDGNLRPIAIQLIPYGEIYTPSDEKEQWMYAKMAVRNADAQYHQIVDHWLNAHAINETFTIAINRTVSRAHPVFRLLFPHLKYTIAINTLARQALINAGGFINQLSSIGKRFDQFLIDEYSKLDFSKLDLPSRLAEQGFTRGNKGALIDFPYMDDGLLVWDAMYEFVDEYLRIYYKSDDDVVNDFEISGLINELQTKGHPNRDFPDVKSIQELQKLLTTIMWTTSCHHSVVNFNQYQMYGYIPNYPFALYLPIPTSKEQISEKFIIESLPGVKAASFQILLVNVLSSYAKNEEYLTSERYMEMIGEEKAIKCLNEYRKRLDEIDSIIKRKNIERAKRGEFYEYKLLLPSKVPNSVAI